MPVLNNEMYKRRGKNTQSKTMSEIEVKYSLTHPASLEALAQSAFFFQKAALF